MSNHKYWWLRTKLRLGLLGVAALTMALLPAVPTAADAGEFNVQVSPSPLVATLTPGQSQTDTITVRNFSNHTETLQPVLNGFTIDNNSQNIQLNDTLPAGMSQWVSFKQSALTLSAGASAPLDVIFHTPKDVGFSYSFAITIKRPGTPTPVPGSGTRLQAGVAIFCLVNISRPDAKSELDITKFASQKSRYNFLPATFTTTVKNNGNIIGNPSGNIFIQRSFDSTVPIATIPLNPTNAHILPGTSRTFKATWQDGFPVYVTTSVNGKPQVHLSWDWKHANDFRFGRYVAKAVMVYDNGSQDTPVITSTTFWVIPWWLLLLSLVVIAVLVTGLIGWGRLIFKGTKKVRGYAKHPHKS